MLLSDPHVIDLRHSPHKTGTGQGVHGGGKGKGGGQGVRWDVDDRPTKGWRARADISLTRSVHYEGGGAAASVEAATEQFKSAGANEVAEAMTPAESAALNAELSGMSYGEVGQFGVETMMVAHDGLGVKSVVGDPLVKTDMATALVASEAVKFLNPSFGKPPPLKQSERISDAVDRYNETGDGAAFRKSLAAEGITTEKAFASALNSEWSTSSQSLACEALQMTVAERNGYPMVDGVPKSMGWLPSGSIDAAARVRDIMPDALNAYVSGQERHTADVVSALKESGIIQKDSITVYRGVSGSITSSLPSPGKTGDIATNPIASWSESRETASTLFAAGDGGGVVVKAEIPLSSVLTFSTASGLGCYNEQEIIVANGSTVNIEVVESWL